MNDITEALIMKLRHWYILQAVKCFSHLMNDNSEIDHSSEPADTPQ